MVRAVEPEIVFQPCVKYAPLADIWWLLEQTDDAECRRVISMTRAPTREQPAHEKNLRDVGPIPIKVRPEVLGGESSCTEKPYIPLR
jgi:hypothetical protein